MFQEEDEEDQQVMKIKIPRFKILHMDLEGGKKDLPEVLNTNERLNTNTNIPDKKDQQKVNLSEKILEYATVSLEGVHSDREIATKLKKKLDEDPELNIPSITSVEKNIDEFGVWQVIVGRQFIASVTFDAKYLMYFLFEEIGKYFLVFRS